MDSTDELTRKELVSQTAANDEVSPPPKSSSPMVHSFSEEIGKIANLPIDKRNLQITSLFALIRENPDAGIAWAAEFFKSEQDADVPDYVVSFSNGEKASARKLRLAILHWLRSIKNPAIETLAGDVLRNARSMEEAKVAARLLEDYSPEKTRTLLAESALRLIAEPSRANPANTEHLRPWFFIDALAYTGDANLLDSARELVRKDRNLAPKYLAALEFFSPELRAKATLDLLESPAITKAVDDSWCMEAVDMASPLVRQKILESVLPVLSEKAKANLFSGPDPKKHNFPWFVGLSPHGAPPISAPHVSFDGWTSLLDALEPFAYTPELKLRLANARQSLPERIAKIERLYSQAPVPFQENSAAPQVLKQ